MISIAEILHIQTDSLLPILLFEASDSGILAVILLGHFHNIHQSAGRDRQRDRRRNQADQGIHCTCQRAGKRKKHGHGSVTDRIAPYTVNSPAITAVRYDKTDNGHKDRGQDGHFLEIQPHIDIIFLKRFQFVRVKMDQVKSFDGLDIGKSLLVKSVELCIHGSTSLVIIPHTPKKRSGKQCAERYSKQCEQRKGRIIVKYDCESTDKTERINDQVWYPVQDSAGNIGSIGAPPCHQIAGMVIRKRFPVSHQHFGKNIVFDL